MYPHLDQSDTSIGNQLHYSSDTPVSGHTLSRTIFVEYGTYQNTTSKTLNQIKGLTDIQVNGYTKDNYMEKSTSGVQGANHPPSPTGDYVSNVSNWIYEKEGGVLPRISYLVNVYLQYNKNEIPRILSCISEGVTELLKTEFNKYSPLFYQKLDNGDYIPNSEQNTSGKVYFTKM